MGILDDAIREHLELKRRRGADPNEVEKLEREALGPVRRGAQASEETLVVEHDEVEPGDDRTLLYDEQADEEFGEPPEFGDEPGVAGEHERFPEDESERGWSHEPTEAWDAEEPLAHEEPQAVEEPFTSEEPVPPAAEPEAPAAAEPTPPPAPAQPRADHPGQETVEYDVEAEHTKPEDDDVLEETPEFLQDTPDHDRLWFEQRPPKDFDFDK